MTGERTGPDVPAPLFLSLVDGRLSSRPRALATRGLVAPHRLALPYERPQLRQPTIHRTQGAGLDQRVAEGGRFDRPSEHRPAAGVGSQLAEQLVVRAATDNVDDLDVHPGQLTRHPDRAPVGQGQTVEDGADQLRPRRWR